MTEVDRMQTGFGDEAEDETEGTLGQHGVDIAEATIPKHQVGSWDRDTKRMVSVVVGWLRSATGQRDLFSLDMWANFLKPWEYARVQDVEFSHTVTGLKLAECPTEPYRVCPARVQGDMTGRATPKRPALNPMTGQPMEYDLDAVYPVNMRVLRYDVRRMPVDMNAAIGGGPSTIQADTALRIARNAGREYLTFERLIAGNTHETKKLGKRGIAYRSADYGLLNEHWLRAFGPLQHFHLRNGCVVLPDEVMRQAHLPFTHQITDPNADIRSWILMPNDHIMAWSISADTYEERIQKYGIRAIDPMRVKNKHTGEVRKLYWLLDNCSFERLVRHFTERCLDPVQPRQLHNCGVDLYPADATDYNWRQLSINKEVTPGSTSPQEIEAIMQKKRRFMIKYALRFVAFPRGTRDMCNLAPCCPPDWPERSKFQDPERSSVPLKSMLLNANKVKKM